jgi:hypothetical protein
MTGIIEQMWSRWYRWLFPEPGMVDSAPVLSDVDETDRRLHQHNMRLICALLARRFYACYHNAPCAWSRFNGRGVRRLTDERWKSLKLKWLNL